MCATVHYSTKPTWESNPRCSAPDQLYKPQLDKNRIQLLKLKKIIETKINLADLQAEGRCFDTRYSGF